MPGQIGAEEIYAAARLAGFSPDQAVTMTAIALAESGGNIDAHNPNGEDSKGLWQINMAAHSGAPWAQGLDLYDPLDNAVAAWNVSQHGQNIKPWTVTHGDRGSPFLDHVDEARQAAAHFGESADGNFANPPANYRSATVSAGDPGDVPFNGQLTAGGSTPPPTAPMPADAQAELDLGEGSVQRFLEAALAQQGDQ